MAVLPINRVAVVAAEIHRALTGVSAADAAQSDAAKERRRAGERAISDRETALLSVAAVAAREVWSREELEEGIAQALSRRNSQSNSVATFASEIKRACHPNARVHAAALAALCAEAWDAEAKATNGYPRPCRKAFQRRYHLLLALLKEAIEGRVFSSRQELVRWAAACDPDNDPAKVLKRVQAHRMQLRALERAWPNSELATAVQALSRITLRSLCAAKSIGHADALPVAA